MSGKAKTLQPKFRLEQVFSQLDANAVLELITPTARTFTCQRTGRLVDGGYCAFFCSLGKEQVAFDPSAGIDVTCPFANNNFLGRMGDGVTTDS